MMPYKKECLFKWYHENFLSIIVTRHNKSYQQLLHVQCTKYMSMRPCPREIGGAKG